MKTDLPALERFSVREMGANLWSLYQSGARNDLLAGVAVTLVLFEDRLVNTATGEFRELQFSGNPSPAQAMAAAAASLVQGKGQGEAEGASSILLLLPPAEFAATSYSMGVSGDKLVRSALQLQVHSLIPAYEEPLLLGVDGKRSQGVALWFPAAKADELFQAFQEQGLFLVAVMPRPLAAAGPRQGERLLIRDEDRDNITLLRVEAGVVSEWLTISRADLGQEPFARQWEQASAQLKSGGAREFTSLQDWTALAANVEPWSFYSFFPAGSQQAGRRLQARKRRKFAAGAGVAAMLLLAVPFISNAMEIRRLEDRAESFREVLSEVLDSQASVFSMEEQWGALSDFPLQRPREILLALDQIIDNSLTSFSLNEGVVDIQGYAQDPAYLVELLAENELFFNVAQSRNISSNNSSRGDQFGIRMNVRNVNFENYYQLYMARPR